MNKELYVSSTPHETKVALVEDDQLAEVFFERENEYTLAGSIYKGRVTRVLPGMQSAFVDIGLERDAFLYVSDFLDHGDEEDEEEFGSIPVPRNAIDVSKAHAATTGKSSRRLLLWLNLRSKSNSNSPWKMLPTSNRQQRAPKLRPARIGTRRKERGHGEVAVAVVADVAARETSAMAAPSPRPRPQSQRR